MHYGFISWSLHSVALRPCADYHGWLLGDPKKVHKSIASLSVWKGQHNDHGASDIDVSLVMYLLIYNMSRASLLVMC